MNDTVVQETFRPMRRSKQQLPNEECVAILTDAYRGFLSVVGENGCPYAVPLNFVYSDGHIYSIAPWKATRWMRLKPTTRSASP